MEPKSGTVAGGLASGVKVEDQIEFDFLVQEMTGVEGIYQQAKGLLCLGSIKLS